MDNILHETSNHSIFLVEPRGDTLVVSPKGERAGFSNVDFSVELKRVQRLLSSGHYRNIILDLSLSNYYGSEMIGVINGLLDQVTRSGGRGGVCNVSPDMAEGLKIMNLDRQWPMYTSKSTAITSIVNESVAQKTSRVAFGKLGQILIGLPAALLVAWIGWSLFSNVDFSTERGLYNKIDDIYEDYKHTLRSAQSAVDVRKQTEPLQHDLKMTIKKIDDLGADSAERMPLSTSARYLLSMMAYPRLPDSDRNTEFLRAMGDAKLVLDGRLESSQFKPPQGVATQPDEPDTDENEKESEESGDAEKPVTDQTETGDSEKS
ncbi:STAS domain-containing protein [Calycomorphotria hydatis]|uniref:STAS domain-containing protein n=1 Tax=Calycomorphotria hydatis TaxID=2528027 RepID=A0A517T348_9PLAN|nr:STAS domain-containing protein [Calycomorphotria hydatis]QDT62805.1 hypothetical protein V22_00030 [Calycomorphotria hydatis]